MALVAVLIGIAGGLGAIFFRFAIRLFQGIFFGAWHYSPDYVLHLPWYVKLLTPALGRIISVLITTRLKKDSNYTLMLTRRGLNVFREQEVNVLQSLQVARVLKTNFEWVHPDTPFRKLMDLTVQNTHSNFFVVDREKKLLGVISIHDVRKVLCESEMVEPFLIAQDFLNPIGHLFTPYDTLDIVMMAFGELHLDKLPVVDSVKNQRLSGTVTKNDVIEAYDKEMVKRDMDSTLAGYASAIHKFKKVEVIDGHLMSEMEVPGEFVNRSPQELNLRNRYGIEVILIKKSFDTGSGEQGKVIRPSADYRFQHGDSILILGSPNHPG